MPTPRPKKTPTGQFVRRNPGGKLVRDKTSAHTLPASAISERPSVSAANEVRVNTRRRSSSRLLVEIEREDDGRWIADVVALPGAMAYGMTRAEALSRAKALALRVLADRLELGEAAPPLTALFQAV